MTKTVTSQMTETRGRPPKIDKSKTIPKPAKGTRRGRPASQYQAQLEIQELMYSHPDKNKVVHKLFTAAMDDDHKNQSVAWKLLMERMAPQSGFEKLKGRSSISINITTKSNEMAEVGIIEGEMDD